MSQHDAFDRILALLHEAAFDDAHWPATAALIDEACGIKGNGLVVGEGPDDDVRIALARLCYRGERRPDLEREYFDRYHPHDERLPRLRQLPDGHLVHVPELYTEQELKTSPTYNEALHRSGAQNGLITRLEGLDGSRIVWCTADPLEAGGWGSAQVELIERLVPHIRRFVQVRQALSSAEALGASLFDLLDNTQVGVIQLDRRGRIVEMNDRARALLRQGDGLLDQRGFLDTWLPADRDHLRELVARTLPTFGGRAPASGSMTVRRSPGMPRLVVHVSPVGVRQTDFGARRVAALVLVVDPARRPRIAPELVAETLGLTPAESQVAALLAEGRTVRDIAAATGRLETSVHWHLKHIFHKQGISRQADLVRLVLSLAEFSEPRR